MVLRLLRVRKMLQKISSWTDRITIIYTYNEELVLDNRVLTRKLLKQNFGRNAG